MFSEVTPNTTVRPRRVSNSYQISKLCLYLIGVTLLTPLPPISQSEPFPLIEISTGVMAGTVVRVAVVVCLLLGAGLHVTTAATTFRNGDGVTKVAPARDPGFEARISQSGLDFLKTVGLDELKKQVQSIKIPDMQGSSDIHHVGKVDYNVYNNRLQSFNIPTATLTTNPTVEGLYLRVTQMSLSVHGDWHYKLHAFIPVSDSGNYDATASDVSLTVTLRVGVDSTGRPTISTQPSDCKFNIGSLHIKLHGGASWLYNLFDDKIEHSLRDALTDSVCKTVLKEVNTDLAQDMKTLKVKVPIDDVAVIDYSLVRSPSFNGSVSTAHKGEVFPVGSTTECPLPVNKIPADPDTSRMVFLWITEYLPNTAGYVLQNIGYLQYNVTPDNVPAEDRSYLNTSNFALAFVIPQINKRYPNMAMQVHLNSTRAPAIKITPSGIQASLVGDFSPYAILPNKSLAYLFTLNVTITCDVTVRMNKNNITWSVSSFKTHMSTTRSAVGIVFTPALQFAVNEAIERDLIPSLNQQGAAGSELPQIQGLSFEKAVITLGTGFLKIGTDLTYSE